MTEKTRVDMEFGQASADFAIVGEVDEVRDQVGALLRIGIHEVICMVPSPVATDRFDRVGDLGRRDQIRRSPVASFGANVGSPVISSLRVPRA